MASDELSACSALIKSRAAWPSPLVISNVTSPCLLIVTFILSSQLDCDSHHNHRITTSWAWYFWFHDVPAGVQPFNAVVVKLKLVPRQFSSSRMTLWMV